MEQNTAKEEGRTEEEKRVGIQKTRAEIGKLIAETINSYATTVLKVGAPFAALAGFLFQSISVTVLFFVVFGIFTLILILLKKRYHKRIAELERSLEEARRKIGILDDMGIHRSIRYDEDKTHKASHTSLTEAWKDFAERIRDDGTDPKILRILGVTGWDTFGKPGSPLHEKLAYFKGIVLILLLNPASPLFKERANSSGAKLEKFQEDHAECVDRCKKLAENGVKIMLRYYDDFKPIWKIVSLDNNYAWVQHYRDGYDVHKTSAYLLSRYSKKGKRRFGTTLLYPITAVFERRWEAATPVLPPPRSDRRHSDRRKENRRKETQVFPLPPPHLPAASGAAAGRGM
ncbi:MAG: signal peptidase complex subunit 1 family protein [Azoarcus sp.]|jgi:DNA-directed RNA polymerase subunit N (RpoN/RPB10)|nr:signal peptidase complex subunit 1 family protein [Azoarcus sp.]